MSGDDEVPFYQSITEEMLKDLRAEPLRVLGEMGETLVQLAISAIPYLAGICAAIVSLVVLVLFLKTMIRAQAIRDPQLDL